MMWCGKDDKCMRLCPFSFGLALGITSFLAVFIWTLWVMYHGVPAMMVGRMPSLSLWGGMIYWLWLCALIKGFIFGFVLVCFYNFFARCCRKMCKKSDEAGAGK